VLEKSLEKKYFPGRESNLDLFGNGAQGEKWPVVNLTGIEPVVGG
jgi:hypothetical protein